MTYGRWYPSVITLPDSRVMAFSGVTKLIKPVYADRPADSGTNVTQSEVYDPKTGEWSVDGGKKSLPLYPRLHLLPNGKVYYDAAGQTFNPAGQAYDEALWNTAATYDPATRTWRDLGLPQFGNGLVGFRGSAFSQMLPLRPDGNGDYRTVEVLSAGGVYGVTPGTYVGTDTSTLNTLTIGEDGQESFSSTNTAPLNIPRWYSTGVSLPTGEVIAFSGADRDEVVAPGSGTPITTPEMYDPRTGEWTELTGQDRGRTYHNTATLLPDGRVLVGGHAPITTGYGKSTDVLEKDPRPVQPEPRPVVRDLLPAEPLLRPAPGDHAGRPVAVPRRHARRRHSRRGGHQLGDPGAQHRDDAPGRLRPAHRRAADPGAAGRQGDRRRDRQRRRAADGPYIVFANKSYEQGETPSVGRQVFVGEVPAQLRDDIAANAAQAVGEEMQGRNAQTAAQASGTPAGLAAAPVAQVRPAALALPATGTPVAPLVLGSVLVGAALVARRVATHVPRR
jgi:hypothetical protein